MLDYTRHRAVEVLQKPRSAVLATSGPAGVQAGEFRFEAVELDVYLLVPRTSDHLYNLEYDSNVTLLTSSWELKGKARVISPESLASELNLLREPQAKWSALVHVNPIQLQIQRPNGWGILETIDLPTSLWL